MPEPPLRAIFESPTIAGMAETILAQKTTQNDPQELERLLDEVETSSKDDPFPSA